MTFEAEPAPSPLPDRRGAREPRRLVLAVVLVLISAVVLVVAFSRTTITYALPAPGGQATHGRQADDLGVLATVVAAAAGMSALGLLVRSVIGRAPRRLWIVVGGLLILAVVLTVAAAVGDSPSF